MNINYKEEVRGFERHLSLNKCVIMPKEDDEIGICKELSQIKSREYKGVTLDNGNIQKNFLSQISNLGIVTKAYYERKIPKTRIVRASSFRNGNAQIIGCHGKQLIYLTSKPFKDTDFIAYSHELGHVPSLENPTKNGNEYFEYLEVLPMYFEYLACKTINKELAYELFNQIRLGISKDEASIFLGANKEINHKSNAPSNKDLFLETVKRESYKYIKSMEYALQLIERSNEDQYFVNQEIDKIVVGDKSFKDSRKSLDINTSGCKKILELIRK